MELRRIKLVIEYDGSEFAGFQVQGRGERTVQGTLQRTLLRLTGADVLVHGAGRTDTGVHALGQVIHFDTDWAVPDDRVAMVLNGALPADLSVRSSNVVERDFHARFSAKQRTYIYAMWTMPQRSALWCRYAAHEPRTLNVRAMRSAAAALTEKRDFASFANSSVVRPLTTVRDLRRFDVKSTGNGKFLLFRLTADGFLRSMVRNLIGGVRSVGLGDIEAADLKSIANTADRTKNPCPAAAANGLCLLRVDY